MGLAATSGSKDLGLATTPDPRALDVDLTARSCHENVITKQKKNLILPNEIKLKKLIEKKKQSKAPFQ